MLGVNPERESFDSLPLSARLAAALPGILNFTPMLAINIRPPLVSEGTRNATGATWASSLCPGEGLKVRAGRQKRRRAGRARAGSTGRSSGRACYSRAPARPLRSCELLFQAQVFTGSCQEPRQALAVGENQRHPGRLPPQERCCSGSGNSLDHTDERGQEEPGGKKPSRLITEQSRKGFPRLGKEGKKRTRF